MSYEYNNSIVTKAGDNISAWIDVNDATLASLRGDTLTLHLAAHISRDVVVIIGVRETDNIDLAVSGSGGSRPGDIEIIHGLGIRFIFGFR